MTSRGDITNERLRRLDSARSTNDAITCDEVIREIEEQRDLLQYEVDGWCIWPLLRFPTQMILQALEPVLSAVRDPFATVRLTAGAINDMVSLIRLPRAPFICKTFSSALGEQTGNRYKDIWFDDLLAGDASVRVRTLNSPAFRQRRAFALVPENITTAHIDFAAAAARRFHLPNKVRAACAAVSSVLNEELGKFAPSTAWIEAQVRHFIVAKEAYKRIIRRVKPRWALTVDASEHALYAAALEMGVGTVEFQHGYSDRFHSAYSWTRSALARKDRMPLPQRIFLYGDHAHREFDFHGFWGSALATVGNMRIDSYRRNERVAQADVIKVVVTTQGIAVPELISFIRGFLTAGAKQPLQVAVKLHPIYDDRKPEYAAALAADPRVTVYRASEGPSTYMLLRGADYNVTISSSSHYDALGLGAQTVVLPLRSYQSAKLLADDGYALLAESPSALAQITADRQRARNEMAPEFFFKPGAIQNIRRELGLR